MNFLEYYDNDFHKIICKNFRNHLDLENFFQKTSGSIFC
jgi:hypothetical protein